MDNINNRYKNIVLFLEEVISKFCAEKNIELRIEIPDEDKLNASVKKVAENKYCINIYPGCLNLHYSIEQLTRSFNEDDLKHFFRFERLDIFEHQEEDTYREKLNNIFVTVILLQILWHEIGHIDAGYVDRTCEYVEFDSNKVGCFAKQEQEMVADWFGTQNVINYIYDSAISGRVGDKDELILALQQLVQLYWITLTIEFQIFEMKHPSNVLDFSLLSHPHPSVRLLYSIEAMAEAIVNIFNIFGLDDDEGEMAMIILIKETYIKIQSFLLMTDTPIAEEKDKKMVMKIYKILRDLPYSKEYEKNNFKHLLPLNSSYEKDIIKFLNSKLE